MLTLPGRLNLTVNQQTDSIRFLNLYLLRLQSLWQGFLLLNARLLFWLRSSGFELGAGGEDCGWLAHALQLLMDRDCESRIQFRLNLTMCTYR
jgi:hypothetical protein